jgi:extradiol dioxygenase family protein
MPINGLAHTGICVPDAGGRTMVEPGISHVGVVCTDIVATRRQLEARGVRFLTSGVAGIAGLRTTWLEDPYGNVIILMEKARPEKPYWRQPFA